MEGKHTQILRLAKPLLETRENVLHTRIACSFARRLLEAEGGDEAVVLPAIMLHDIGWKSVPEELHLKAFGPRGNDLAINRIHEVEGARKAREILQQVGYDPELIDEICEIILGHDSRERALSLNDAIVKDSDKLWRFSADALRVDPKRFKVSPVVHAHWLGRQIDRWFITETARKIAGEEQRQRLISFGVLQEDDGSPIHRANER